MRVAIRTTYHRGDGPFALIGSGLGGGVGRFFAFLRPFETGMRRSITR